MQILARHETFWRRFVHHFLLNQRESIAEADILKVFSYFPKLVSVNAANGDDVIATAIKNGFSLSIIGTLISITKWTPEELDAIIQSTHSLNIAIRKESLLLLGKALQSTQLIATVSIHICGFGTAGKTTLTKTLKRYFNDSVFSFVAFGKTEPIPIGTRAMAMEVSQLTKGQKRLVVYDYGGQEEFHVNHAQFLSKAQSVYVIVLALWDPRIDRLMTMEEIGSSYVYWLKFINSVTKSNSPLTIRTVANFKSKVPSQQHISEVEKLINAIQSQSVWASSRFNFLDGFSIIECNELGDVKASIGKSLEDWIERQNANTTKDSPEDFDYACVTAVKADLVNFSILISYEQFDIKIKEIIMRTFGRVANNDKALRYLADVVYNQLTSAGDIVTVNKAWVVTNPSWLTRDVLGALVKANKMQKQDIMTAEYIHEIVSRTASGSYSDKTIFAELLKEIGACIRVENVNQSNVWYFPIFGIGSIKETVSAIQRT